MARKIEVQITGDASSLRRAIGDAEGSSSRLGGALGGMAKAAVIAGGAAGLGAIAIGAKGAIDAASNLGESVNAINVSFGKAAPQVLKFTQSAAKIGLSARAANEALVPIGAGLQNAGLSADAAAKASINLTKRAADMASVFNTSLDDALGAIQAGLRGEADPLERFGVGLSAANVNAKAMALGLAESEKALTAQDKATARVALIMDQTNKVAGDFTNTSDGLANSQRILSAEIENAQAKIGQELTPVMATATQALASAIPHVLDFASGLMDRLRPAIEAVGGFVSSVLLPAFRDELIPVFKDRVLPIILQVRDIFVLMIQRVGGVLAEHRAELVDTWKNLASAVESMWAIVGPLVKFAFTEVLPVALEVAIVAINLLSKAIRAIATTMESVAAVLTPIISRVKDAFVGAFEFVVEKGQAFIKFWKDLPGNVAEAISAGAGAVKKAVLGLFDKLPGFVKDALGIASPSKVFAEIGENIVEGTIKGIRGKAGDLIDAAWDAFGGVSGIAGDLIGGLKGLFKGGGDTSTLATLLGFAKSQGITVTSTTGGQHVAGSFHYQGRAIDVAGSFNQMAAFFSAALRTFGGSIRELFFDPMGFYIDNGRAIRGAIGGHSDHVHLALATGGIVTQPTRALIGEAGAEAVIPLRQMGTLGEWEVIPGGYSDKDVVSNQTLQDVGQLIGQTTVTSTLFETQTIGGFLAMILKQLETGFQAVVDAVGRIPGVGGGGGGRGGSSVSGGGLDWTLPPFGDPALGPIGGMGTGGTVAGMTIGDFVNAGGFFTSGTQFTFINEAPITSPKDTEDMIREALGRVLGRQGFS